MSDQPTFTGSADQQALAEQVFQIMKAQGSFFALDAPIRQTLDNLADYFAAQRQADREKVAMELGAAFVPARKPGKLPYTTISYEYDLEYGSNRLEMHTDALKEWQRVLVMDDLLATGGTALAACKLIGALKAEVVACCFVIELGFLNGRNQLGPVPVESILIY